MSLRVHGSVAYVLVGEASRLVWEVDWSLRGVLRKVSRGTGRAGSRGVPDDSERGSFMLFWTFSGGVERGGGWNQRKGCLWSI